MRDTELFSPRNLKNFGKKSRPKTSVFLAWDFSCCPGRTFFYQFFGEIRNFANFNGQNCGQKTRTKKSCATEGFLFYFYPLFVGQKNYKAVGVVFRAADQESKGQRCRQILGKYCRNTGQRCRQILGNKS